VATLLFIIIVLSAFAGTICICTWTHRKETGSKPERLDDQYRIVELHNGKYRVEQYRYWYNDWGTPEDIGEYVFDTLDAARNRKNSLVARMSERAGYRMKKVVG